MKKFSFGVFAVSAALALTLGLAACGTTPSAHEHNLTPVAATSSTCEEHGKAAHFTCDGCDKLFTDEEGKTEVTEAQLSLPLAQHYYKISAGATIYGAAKSNATQHWYKCEVCQETTEKVNHTFTTVKGKAATATENGYDAGEVCLECGYRADGKKVYPKTTLFKSETYNGLNYCSYEPDGIQNDREKLPLVVFLHGSGERGTDNVAQLKNAVQEVVFKGSESKFMKSIFLAPQCPAEPEQWANTPWADGNYSVANVAESESNKKVVELINHYISKGYADSDRIYIMGISMGGFGAWDLMARHPELFAAGVPICGGGPADKVDVLKNIPIYAFHSDNDTSVPYAGTRDMVQAIRTAGGTQIEFVTFNKGHMIWDDAITYDGLEDWLFSKSKS